MARNQQYAYDVDASFYYAMYPDLAADGVPAPRHFHLFGWHEGRNPNTYFDTLGYLESNPDVAAAGVDPLAHYLTFGRFEGRFTSPAFDGQAYLAANPDVAAAGFDPLTHFLRYGRYEGRQAIAKPLVDVDGSGNAVAENAGYGTGTGVNFSWADLSPRTSPTRSSATRQAAVSGSTPRPAGCSSPMARCSTARTTTP